MTRFTDPSPTDDDAVSVPRRGDVLRVKLDPVVGSEQGGERPVLVLSPDYINSRSPVVLVAAVTSRKTDRVYSFEALLELGDGGLPQRSKAMLLQMRSLDKTRIVSRYGRISSDAMARVEDALRIATGITSVEPPGDANGP